MAGENETINTFTDDVDNGSFTTTKGAKHLFAEKSYIALPIVNSGGTASDNKLKSSYKFAGLSFYGGENQSNGVLPGQGGHKTGEIGRDANSKEFYALPNKIKNDGKVKSIEIIVPAIISVTLNKREQSVIHNSMELLGQAMKNVLQKSGVNHVTYRVEDVYYSPNVVNNVTTNRPKDEIRVNVIK